MYSTLALGKEREIVKEETALRKDYVHVDVHVKKGLCTCRCTCILYTHQRIILCNLQCTCTCTCTHIHMAYGTET